MTKPRLARHQPSLEDLEVLVLGLGRSGLAAVRLARARGASVTAADSRSEEALGAAVTTARDLGAKVLTGGHPAALALKTDLVVASPGIPSDVEILLAARRLEIPVWSEIELAARFCRGAIIAITGSNGKSTVTSMAGTILRGAGRPGGTGGNLAIPFADLLGEDSAEAIHALELSSFQLEAVDAFSPDVAAILNLSPDHLDRYPDYEAYAGAKARLLEVQTGDAHAILNADDSESERFRKAVRGRLHLFSTCREVSSGAFLRQGRLILRLEEGEVDLMAAEELPVPGEHNIANALTAALACTLAGCPADAVAAGLRRYEALRHRLEHVLTLSGIAFYNDSKATNPASAARALCSFAAGKVHLIMGGKAKGTSWEELADLVEQRAKQVLLVGEASDELWQVLSGRVALLRCETIRRAVETAYAAAENEEIVLLSPACASFDQYANFEERGDDFRDAARALRADGGSDA